MKINKITIALAFVTEIKSEDKDSAAILHGEEAKKHLFKARQRSVNKEGGLSAFGFNMAALDYGCHCSAIITGQYHGHGQAVDPLDAVCKEYLGCIRCVKKQTQCEKIDTYHYTMKQDITVDCLDPSGSCSRSSCECDGKLFADIWHLATNGMDYDFQFSSAYFDREKNCRKNDMTRSDSFIKEIKAQFDTQCCGGNEYPMEHFNVLKYKCCDNGDGNKRLKRQC